MRECSNLFARIDAKPFRPFTIDLISGRRVEVAHPDHILVAPTHNRVHHIEVYKTDPVDMVIIWSGNFVALSYPATDAAAS